MRLVEVTSNIWGTKFKLHGVAGSVPANLGQITYKTSLLHLQPRQMTLVITELRDDFPVGPDPNFNPNVFSEDEDDINQDDNFRFRSTIDSCPPIAPMSPRNRLPKPKSQLLHHLNSEVNTNNSANSTKRDAYDEEFPYVELTETLIRPHSHITSHSSLRNGNGTQSTSFVGSVSRNSPLNSTTQRHAISPLCCEVSVPALQSPKNAVAPSDIIFDRPPAQTLLSYSTNDYFNSPANVHQMKSTMANEQSKYRIMNINLNSEQMQASVKRECDNSENLNKVWKGSLRGSIKATASNSNILNNINDTVKWKETNNCTKGCTEFPDNELTFIDELSTLDTPGPSTSNLLRKSRVLTESMVRSCSVGYLDLVDAQLIPSDMALLMLRKDTPKRLVLVKNKQKRQSRPLNRHFQIKHAKNNNTKSPKLKNCVKSRSLDSSDIFPIRELDGIKSKPTTAIISETEQTNSVNDSNNLDSIVKANETSKNVIYCNNNENIKPNRTDNLLSPLKRMKQNDIKNSNIKNMKNTCNLKELNTKRTPTNTNIECSSSRPSASIHSQALASLENLLTKLREDDRKSRSPSPRMPRSSPSSPAPSKKGRYLIIIICPT